MRNFGLLIIVASMLFLAATQAHTQDKKQKATDVDAILQEINASQLRRDLAIAEFYRRTGHPGSAFYYYKLIRKRYPNTESAKNAAERIVELVDGGFVQDDGSNIKPPKAVEASISDPVVRQELSNLREQVKNLEKRIAALESKPSAARVGEVIVVGNTKTATSDILKHLAIYPGEVLQYPSLPIAEEKLTKLGIFVVDAQKGIRPTVSVLDNDGPFKDILVRVQEAGTGRK